MVVEDNEVKIYLDWTFVCSSTSIEQSLGIIVGLYSLMNLKFNTYRTALRFLYVYFMNDKLQQSNNIRKFCKEYNIALQDKPSSSSISRFEETENNNGLINHENKNTDVDSTIMYEHNSNGPTLSDIQVSASEPIATDQQAIRKRKVDQLLDSEVLREQNGPPTKKNTRVLREKRQ
jgi:hypothetical protein